MNNKPLVEAIFEMRWKLQESDSNFLYDPHYKLVIGRLYDRIIKYYPFHEQLQSAEMPDEMASYIVQHRFRTEKKKWPLVQLGPGIITINDMEGYVWDDFEKRISYVVTAFFDAYPKQDAPLIIDRVLLRYIDAIDFDFSSNDVLEFLGKMMNTKIELCPNLFKDTPVKKSPINCNLIFSFEMEKPKSIIHLRFVKGVNNGIESLFWETMVQSVSDSPPKNLEEIS
ncbi:MAG: TIGR04255 family protein, partial [Candidatus Thermoplasmatota archaeon]|nr:TIGR04255 family protein [Candidatus Thermoplasmatota archaeon]